MICVCLRAKVTLICVTFYTMCGIYSKEKKNEYLLCTQSHTHAAVNMYKQTQARLKPSYIHCCYLVKGLVQRERDGERKRERESDRIRVYCGIESPESTCSSEVQQTVRFRVGTSLTFYALHGLLCAAEQDN